MNKNLPKEKKKDLASPRSIVFFAALLFAVMFFTVKTSNAQTCDYNVPFSGNNSITASSGFICDHAGFGVNYSDNANGYTIINPVVPTHYVRLNFTHFELEGCCDYVTVYDGAGLSGTVLFSGFGTTMPPELTSSTGPLTISFTSDYSVVYPGFRAEISNIICVDFLETESGVICDNETFNWRGNVYSTTGIYYDSLVSVLGCDSVYRLNLTVNPTPDAPINISATPSTLCYGSTTTLSATATTDSVYWYTQATGGVDIGASASGAGFVVTPDSTTTYYAEAYSSGLTVSNILVLDVECSSSHWLTPYADALDSLGLTNVSTTDEATFINYLNDGTIWDLVIYNQYLDASLGSTFQDLYDYLVSGGKLIYSSWDLQTTAAATNLYNQMGISASTEYSVPLNMYCWDTIHPVFSFPNTIPTSLIPTFDPCNSDGQLLTILPGAEAVAGYTALETPGQAGIVVNQSESSIYMGQVPFVFSSTDLIELLENQIHFLLYSSMCPSATRTPVTVTVNQLPAAAGTISGSDFVCQGATAVPYNVPAIANAVDYVWEFSGTGATINGTTSNVTIDFDAVATSGNLTVKGSNTCGEGVVSADFAITLDPCSGIDEENADIKVEIIPNPSDGQFSCLINTDKTQLCKLNINDINGKTVWSEELTIQAGANKIELNMVHLANGTYFLSGQTEAYFFKKVLVIKK